MSTIRTASRRATIGVTLGDAAGIGPEIVRSALGSGRLDEGFDYIIVGDTRPCEPGHPTPATAQESWHNLERAAEGAIGGELAAVVTGPVCKAGLYGVGFPYPGQTEFFAARCGTEDFAMMLTGGAMTVALVSAAPPVVRRGPQPGKCRDRAGGKADCRLFAAAPRSAGP